MTRWGSSAALAAAVLLTAAPACVVEVAASPSPHRWQAGAVAERCRISEGELDELSGLAADGKSWYAVADDGSSIRVHVLNPVDCSERGVRIAPSDPFDVEDMALGTDGALWLADTGDNRRQRDTVAMHVLPVKGAARLFRMTYPDGPHDAEALLLDRSGVPYLVTKEPLGVAGIYRPAGPLMSESPVPLERVGSLPLRPTDSPGGPLSGTLGSVLVTGGAVSHDGTAVAIRTYTEAYLYSAPDGDIARALTREPVRIPLAGEPQGEAIAFEPDGTLLSAGENSPVVREVRNAAAAASAGTGTSQNPTTPPAPPGVASEPGPPGEAPSQFSAGKAFVFAGVVAALILVARVKRRRSQ